MTAEVAPPPRAVSATDWTDDDTDRRLRIALRTACPPLEERLDPLAERLSRAYATYHDRIQEAAAKPSDSVLVGSSSLPGIRSVLREPLEAALLSGIPIATDYHAEAAGRRLETQLDADATVSVDADWEGYPVRYAQRTLDRLLVVAETIVVRRLRTARIGTGDPRRAVATAFDDLRSREPRRLAAAGLLLATRSGAQALPTATDAAVAKQWHEPDELRCPAHDEMDGAVAPADRCFTVDAGTARRSAFLVGENAPLVCSCVQRPVVVDVPPSEPRALAARDGVSVHVAGTPVTPLSDRQREVFREHARPGESFPALLERVHAEYSVRGGARELGVAKKSLYRWFDDYIDGFDRYSGR